MVLLLMIMFQNYKKLFQYYFGHRPRKLTHFVLFSFNFLKLWVGGFVMKVAAK